MLSNILTQASKIWDYLGVWARASCIHHQWASIYPQDQKGLLLTISHSSNTISYDIYFSDSPYTVTDDPIGFKQD